MFDKTYLTPTEAIAMILDNLPLQATRCETLRIEECYGRIAASDVVSAEDLPGFARSTMDGYAVRSSDTYGARETLPAYIAVFHEVFMGEKIGFEIKAE